MNRVVYPNWDDPDETVILINEVKHQIAQVIESIDNCDNYNTDIEILLFNIEATLNRWTGHTYIGNRKTEQLKQAYQGFFEELYQLLIKFRDVNDSDLNELAATALYQGVVYRYLGYDSPMNNTKQRIRPIFDGVYVSWSKLPRNDYIELKLYGTKTIITGCISNDYYGIDLEPFGVVRGDESEVVFPTIEQTIKRIVYIEDESDEDSTL